jgi:hypothetical protein
MSPADTAHPGKRSSDSSPKRQLAGGQHRDGTPCPRLRVPTRASRPPPHQPQRARRTAPVPPCAPSDRGKRCRARPAVAGRRSSERSGLANASNHCIRREIDKNERRNAPSERGEEPDWRMCPIDSTVHLNLIEPLLKTQLKYSPSD